MTLGDDRRSVGTLLGTQQHHRPLSVRVFEVATVTDTVDVVPGIDVVVAVVTAAIVVTRVPVRVGASVSTDRASHPPSNVEALTTTRTRPIG